MPDNFNLIAFQDALVARFVDIETNGVGKHRRRSHFSARSKAVLALVKLGYPAEQARLIVRDAKEMADLHLAAEED